MLRRHSARLLQTHRDGLPHAVRLSPEGYSASGASSFSARALHAPRRQVELLGRQHLDPEGVHEGTGVAAERGEGHLGGRPPGEPAARLGVDLRHHESGVRARRQVEIDPAPLGQ